MNVAPDQTIILGLQIFLDNRSLSSIDQKILEDNAPQQGLSVFIQSFCHSLYISFCLSVFYLVILVHIMSPLFNFICVSFPPLLVSARLQS